MDGPTRACRVKSHSAGRANAFACANAASPSQPNTRIHSDTKRYKTLLWLLALSLATTLLARFAPGGTLWVSLAFLLLSGWKARHILNGYLDLGASRFWRRAFNGFIALFLVLAGALYLLPDML